METCEDGERVCLFYPKGMGEACFYFYIGVLKDSKIQILFSDFAFQWLGIHQGLCGCL